MIEPASPSDVDNVSTLIDAAYRDYVPRLGRNPQPMSDDYQSLVADGQVWVVKHNGTMEGVAVLQPVDGHLLVRTVGIAPACQRKGLGSQLMAFAEDFAHRHGISQLRLYTNEVMTGNVDFYQRHGYCETHRTGPDGTQVIYMLKELKNG